CADVIIFDSIRPLFQVEALAAITGDHIAPDEVAASKKSAKDAISGIAQVYTAGHVSADIVAFDGVAGGLIDVEAVAVEAINHQPLDGGETCEEGQPRTGARVAPFDLDERLAGIARLRGPVNGYWSVNRRQAGQHRDS